MVVIIFDLLVFVVPTIFRSINFEYFRHLADSIAESEIKNGKAIIANNWAKWWIRHPVQHQVFRLFQITRTLSWVGVAAGLFAVFSYTFLYFTALCGLYLIGSWVLWQVYAQLYANPVMRAQHLIQAHPELLTSTRIALEERRERDATVAAHVKLLGEIREAEAQNTIVKNKEYKKAFLTFSQEHGFYISDPYEDHGDYNIRVFAPEGMVFEGEYGSRSKITFLWSHSIKAYARLTEPNWIESLDNLKKFLPLKQSTLGEEVWFMGTEKDYRKGIEQALQSLNLNLMMPR